MKNAATTNTVAIVIPAKNEARFIEACLRSIKAQDYPEHLVEVVVVDNGSTDATPAMVKQSGVKLLTYPQGRVGAVRNFGVKHSSGDFVAFIDADCVAPQSWLSESIGTLLRTGAGAVGGQYRAGQDANWVQRTLAFAADYDLRKTDALAGGSFILTRELFTRLGGFNEKLSAAEDDDLSQRIRAAGFDLLMVPGCDVQHLGYPASLKGVGRRQIWLGGNQLDTLNRWRDKLNIATHLYLLAIIVAIASPLVGGTVGMWFIAAAISVIVGIAFVAGAFKARQQERSLTLASALRHALLQCFSLGGRAFGLLVNYGRRLKSIVA